jgi:hypothetical protein
LLCFDYEVDPGEEAFESDCVLPSERVASDDSAGTLKRREKNEREGVSKGRDMV